MSKQYQENTLFRLSKETEVPQFLQHFVCAKNTSRFDDEGR